MTDPLDTWKSKEEDAIIARSEQRESTRNMNEPCDECGVDTVALLDERDQLRAKCEQMGGALDAIRSACHLRGTSDGELVSQISNISGAWLHRERMLESRLKEARRLLKRCHDVLDLEALAADGFKVPTCGKHAAWYSLREELSAWLKGQP